MIDTLAELFAMRGVPRHIRSDNGPEFIAAAIRRWLDQVGIEALYIEPGSPWENGIAESFHGRVRDEFLGTEIFDNLTSARTLTAAWKEDYNHHRPLSSLGYQTFALECVGDQRAIGPTAGLQGDAGGNAATTSRQNGHGAGDSILGGAIGGIPLTRLGRSLRVARLIEKRGILPTAYENGASC